MLDDNTARTKGRGIDSSGIYYPNGQCQENNPADSMKSPRNRETQQRLTMLFFLFIYTFPIPVMNSFPFDCSLYYWLLLLLPP